MSFLIGRPINGISLNGLEYACDENGMAILFYDLEEAKKYLLDHGVSEIDIDYQGIVFEKVGEDSEEN